MLLLKFLQIPAVVSTNKISLAADKRPVKIQRNAKGLGFAVVSDGPVIVTSVENGGPAAAGGLLKGDMILAVNGKEVHTSTYQVVNFTIPREVFFFLVNFCH